MFDNVKKADIQEEDKDVLGGSYVWESGIYPVTIKNAYADKSNAGAEYLQVEFSDGKRSLSIPIYYTNRNGENFYIDKKTGEKHLLPGWQMVRSLTQCAVGKEPEACTHEMKTVKVYNSEAKKEIPEQRPVLTDIIGKPVMVGVLHVKENKRTKDSSGKYVPTPDIREFNDLSKIFTKDGFTSVEKKGGAESPEFIHKWKEKWEGKTLDKTVEVKSPAPSSPAKPTESLF